MSGCEWFTQEDVKQLFLAVKNSDLAECRQIVQRCGEAIITAPCRAFYRNTALHRAVDYHPDILEFFVAQRINYNVVNGFGNTALMLAVFHGHSAGARLLIECGADTTLRDPDGRTALDSAREMNRTDLITALEEHERLRAAQQNIKPAPRNSVEPIAQQTAEETVAGSVFIPLGQQFGGSFEDVHDQSTDHGLPESDPSVNLSASTLTLSTEKSPLNSVPLPAMSLGLTDLDLELSE
eukprot:m.88005 g.88005  ORF g.88005 m.88005 type:complete len:238 (+) comp51002_c0_seq5:89-802(+)